MFCSCFNSSIFFLTMSLHWMTTLLPNILFCWLFIATSSKYYFGNPHWYMEWLGTVDPGLSLGPENPPVPFSVATPPPPSGHDRGIKMVIRQSDCTACLPGHVGRGRSSNTQERLFFSSDSSVTVLKQTSGRFCLDLDLHSLFWKSANRHGIITIFLTYHHHLSSSSRNLTTCSTTQWK
jgi:hypothetical protein